MTIEAQYFWLQPDEVAQARALWRDCVDAQLFGIISELAQATKYSIDDLIGQGRTHDLSRARMLGYTICRSRGYSLPQIAKAFHRDHTTVMHGLKVYAEENGA